MVFWSRIPWCNITLPFGGRVTYATHETRIHRENRSDAVVSRMTAPVAMRTTVIACPRERPTTASATYPRGYIKMRVRRGFFTEAFFIFFPIGPAAGVVIQYNAFITVCEMTTTGAWRDSTKRVTRTPGQVTDLRGTWVLREGSKVLCTVRSRAPAPIPTFPSDGSSRLQQRDVYALPVFDDVLKFDLSRARIVRVCITYYTVIIPSATPALW